MPQLCPTVISLGCHDARPKLLASLGPYRRFQTSQTESPNALAALFLSRNVQLWCLRYRSSPSARRDVRAGQTACELPERRRASSSTASKSESDDANHLDLRTGARIAGTAASTARVGRGVDCEAGVRKGRVGRWMIANHRTGGVMTY